MKKLLLVAAAVLLLCQTTAAPPPSDDHLEEVTDCGMTVRLKEKIMEGRGQEAHVDESDKSKMCTLENDELLDERMQLSMMNELKRRHTRAIVSYPTARWDNGTIPWYSTGHSEGEKKVLRQAMADWSADTCLTFEEVSETDTRPRLMLKRSGTSCISFVGKAEKQPQPVYIPENCFTQE